MRLVVCIAPDADLARGDGNGMEKRYGRDATPHNADVFSPTGYPRVRDRVEKF